MAVVWSAADILLSRACLARTLPRPPGIGRDPWCFSACGELAPPCRCYMRFPVCPPVFSSSRCPPPTSLASYCYCSEKSSAPFAMRGCRFLPFELSPPFQGLGVLLLKTHLVIMTLPLSKVIAVSRVWGGGVLTACVCPSHGCLVLPNIEGWCHSWHYLLPTRRRQGT